MERNEAMAEMFRAGGCTYEAIGARFNVSKQRVYEVLHVQMGLERRTYAPPAPKPARVYDGVCIVCGREFEAHRPRRTCSRRHSEKYNRNRARYNAAAAERARVRVARWRARRKLQQQQAS